MIYLRGKLYVILVEGAHKKRSKQASGSLGRGGTL